MTELSAFGLLHSGYCIRVTAFGLLHVWGHVCCGLLACRDEYFQME